MSFDVDWPHGHVTEDGHKARVVCSDRKNDTRPLIVLVTGLGGDERVETYRADGRYYDGLHHNNLHNAPAPKPRIKGWVNIYAKNTSDNREQADLRAGSTRRACICIDIEEGEGL